MSTDDRFAPPRARVDDVADPASAATGYQPVKIWSAKGRMGRLRLMAYSMAAYLVTIVLTFVFGLGGAFVGDLSGAGAGATIIMLLLFVPYFVLTVMFYIQRSHDMGWSGWSVLALLIPLAALLWIFKAGTPGSNAYGNPPPPNSLAVKILGLFLPVVGTIGILAAVALPAYMQYKAAASGALEQSAPPAMPAVPAPESR